MLPFKPSPVRDPERAYFERCGPREKETRSSSSSAAKLQRLETADQRAASSFAATDPSVETCPLKPRHALEATVVDGAGVPIENVTVELRKSDTEALVAKSDAGGWVRFVGLEEGAYQLGLPAMDQDAWAISAGEALPADRDRCQGDAAWKAPVTLPQEGPRTHVVEQGQCISTLAYRYGFLVDTLWSRPENEALKGLRKIKNILLPKDEVFIPERQVGLRDVSAKSAYRLERRAAAEEVRIRFLDRRGKPRAGEAYLLSVTSPTGSEDRMGDTDGEGFVIASVPSSTTGVKIVLGKDDARETFVFGVAQLDPLETLTGIQGRLDNLGYPCSKDAGKLGAFTRRALRDFQRDEGLTVTGELDAGTRSAIETKYLT